MGRTVVGDIHGCLDELTALLATARFSADPAGRAWLRICRVALNGVRGQTTGNSV